MSVSDDPEAQKLWSLQKAWGIWAMRQPGEKLANRVAALATMFYPRTENHALLNEAAIRLKNTKPRKIKVRHNDPDQRPGEQPKTL